MSPDIFIVQKKRIKTKFAMQFLVAYMWHVKKKEKKKVYIYFVFQILNAVLSVFVFVVACMSLFCYFSSEEIIKLIFKAHGEQNV